MKTMIALLLVTVAWIADASTISNPVPVSTLVDTMSVESSNPLPSALADIAWPSLIDTVALSDFSWPSVSGLDDSIQMFLSTLPATGSVAMAVVSPVPTVSQAASVSMAVVASSVPACVAMASIAPTSSLADSVTMDVASPASSVAYTATVAI